MVKENYNADKHLLVEAEQASMFETKGVEEMFDRPDMLFLIFASIFVLFAGAIRLTRFSAVSTVESFHSYVESGHRHLSKVGICKSLKGTTGILSSFTSFWKKMPRRVWSFFIDSFLIPSYRKEWGKYRMWSHRSRKRPKKPAYLRLLLKSQKRSRRSQQSPDKFHVTPHNHNCCQRVRINIGGMRFETQLRTLDRFPDTLLGNAEKRIQYYDSTKQEYYFDRNRNTFEAILHFYQSGGKFRRPDDVQADVLLEDAQFFQLNRVVIEQFQIEEGLTTTNSKHEIVPKGFLRRKIWLLFDFPESSLQAEYVGILSIVILFVSISAFCIETIDSIEMKSVIGVIDFETGRVDIVKQNIMEEQDILSITERVCNIWFFGEFFLRFTCCPLHWKFLKDPLNLIDLIALVPFLLSLVSPLTALINGEDPASSPADSLHLIRIVRVVRVFRIFKISRHSKALKILGKTLKSSLNELILLIFFIILGVILFSSAVYFAELDDPKTQFHSIPGGFWWALITITTVGFGDYVPKTVLGKVVGALCAVAGVLTIALPVPVIVSNFNFFYHQSLNETDLRLIKFNHVPACPYRTAGYDNRKKTKNPTVYSSDEEFESLKQAN